MEEWWKNKEWRRQWKTWVLIFSLYVARWRKRYYKKRKDFLPKNKSVTSHIISGVQSTGSNDLQCFTEKSHLEKNKTKQKSIGKISTIDKKKNKKYPTTPTNISPLKQILGLCISMLAECRDNGLYCNLRYSWGYECILSGLTLS